MFRASLLGLPFALLIILALPAGSAAQEAEEADPMVLRISFYKCNLSGDNGDAIAAEANEDVEVWKALMSEGRIVDHGYFYHWWADEWNVGIYTIGTTIQGILDAVEEAGDRLEAVRGDAPSAVGTHCPEHKDGFYTMGPSAAMPGGN